MSWACAHVVHISTPLTELKSDTCFVFVISLMCNILLHPNQISNVYVVQFLKSILEPQFNLICSSGKNEGRELSWTFHALAPRIEECSVVDDSYCPFYECKIFSAYLKYIW